MHEKLSWKRIFKWFIVPFSSEYKFILILLFLWSSQANKIIALCVCLCKLHFNSTNLTKNACWRRRKKIQKKNICSNCDVQVKHITNNNNNLSNPEKNFEIHTRRALIEFSTTCRSFATNSAHKSYLNVTCWSMFEERNEK